MLNLIMTHSPRMAAMTNNKRYGEDTVKRPALLHRMALRKPSHSSAPVAKPSTAEQFREQTA
jgi:hypothetical protein